MDRVSIIIAFSFVLAVITGCENKEKVTTLPVSEKAPAEKEAEPKSEANVEADEDSDFESFMQSETYARIKNAGFQPALLGVREPGSKSIWVELQAGVNTPERFVTWEHLRISSDGLVERKNLLGDGWLNDLKKEDPENN